MKKLTVFSIVLVIFTAAPVFACGGGNGDKGKGDKALTINVQALCDGKKGDKPDSQPQLLCGGGSKDKDKDGPKT